MTDIALAGTSTNTNSTGTALSVNSPASTAVGDLLVFWTHVNGQTTIADNNGSTATTKASISGDDGSGNYKPNTTSGQTAAVFHRYVQSGDPTTWNFTGGASGRWTVTAGRFTNPHSSVVYDVGPTGGNNSDGVGAAKTVVTVTTANDLSIHMPVLFLDGVATGSEITAYPYASNNLQSGANGELVAICSSVITSAGATGNKTYTSSRDDAYFGISLAIRNNTGAAASRNSTYTRALMGVGR